MRKADYSTLARAIRRDVEKAQNWPALNQTHDEYLQWQARAAQARNLARYLADHLAVDRFAFLNACGVKP